MTSVDQNKSLTIIDVAEDEPAPEEELILDTSAEEPSKAGSLFDKLIRKITPRRLLARSILIIVIPVVVMQCIVTYIFFERHWDTVTRHLSAAVAGEIALIIETKRMYPDATNWDDLRRLASMTTELRISHTPNSTIPTTVNRSFFPALDRKLAAELDLRIDEPFWLDTVSDPEYVDIYIQLGDDVLRVRPQRKQVNATSGPIFLIWMFGISSLLLAVAVVFIRNQVRTIQKLADAAESFGKGQDAKNFKPTGATEVRQAAESFIEMRDRIRRQIEQRTLLLAGVSHDLRTPITRMKLQTALMAPSPELEALREDISEMEHMLEEYLAFARGQGSEAAVYTDVAELLRDIRNTARRSGADIGLDIRGDMTLRVRRNALRRCITNLVDNAVDHGSKVAIIATRRQGFIEIAVDDDGPGIPADQVEEAFKPFNRLDESRNLDGGGVGLGLAIAQDVAHVHGGEIQLLKSPWSGLRALVRLPV